MTRYLLDTSVIGDITQASPPQALLDWMAAQADDDLYVASLSVLEICRAILATPADSKGMELRQWLTGDDGPETLFAGRVLPFDDRASRIWARLMLQGLAEGQRRSGLDMMIAAIAEAHDCVVVTSNEPAFAGLPIVNPLRKTS